MRGRVWRAHPFAWAASLGLIALVAVLLAITSFRDPHAAARRSFLRECRAQMASQSLPGQCAQQATARFGPADSAGRAAAYAVAAICVLAGTTFVVVYLAGRVGESAGPVG